MNKQQPGTLPRNTIQNPKNNDHYLSITTRSGKTTIDPLMPVVDESMNESVDVDEISKAKIKKSTGGCKSIDKEKGKG